MTEGVCNRQRFHTSYIPMFAIYNHEIYTRACNSSRVIRAWQHLPSRKGWTSFLEGFVEGACFL